MAVFILHRRRCTCDLANFKHADDLGQIGGLALHGFGRGLFHQRRSLLRDLVHLADSDIHLFDADALLGAGRRDFADEVGHTLDAADRQSCKHPVGVGLWPKSRADPGLPCYSLFEILLQLA